MEKQQKKQIKKYISWALIVVVVGLLAALPMIAANEEQATGPQASVLSAEAEVRSIPSAIMGGGTLIAENAVHITIPAEVKITEYLVKNGDFVTEGQAIASVDRVSVMAAITQVQETLNELNDQMNDVSSDTESNKITATAGGTVKEIYAQVGEDVQDVLLRDGALAVLSLDGMMAVQINCSTNLAGGDTVCVTLSNGTEVSGKVESNLDGVLTITIEDDGYCIGETVTVTTEDSVPIGSGSLYVHSQWNVVAYSGDISRIRVNEGEEVSAGRTLFNLEIEGHTADYDALARKHRKYEELMLELFKMYQSTTVTAPTDGMVTGVDETGAYMLSDHTGTWSISLLANAPDGKDDISYANLVGIVKEVGIDGLILKVNPSPFEIADYMNLPEDLMDTGRMTEDITYTMNAPIYALSDVPVTDSNNGGTSSPSTTTPSTVIPGATTPEASTPVVTPAETTPSATEGGVPTTPVTPGTPETGNTTKKEWIQISPYAITEGDILLFAFSDSGIAWVIRVGNKAQNNPSNPGGTFPQGGGVRPGMGGSMYGIGGGMAAEEDDGLYGLDTVTIASVTAQNTTSIQITIDELDISKVYLGQAATVTINALIGQQFAGTVTDISASGENDGGNSKFTVEVTVDKTADMLAGMNASVSLGLESTENAVCIPVAALIENGTGTQVYTDYDEDNKAFLNPVTVTVGTSDGEYVQILSGIEAGQTVYYPYYDTLVISNAPEMGFGFSF